MTRLIAVAAAVAALTGVGTSAASLVPGISDPGNTGCVNATFSNGVLHLEKNCPTATNAAAGADSWQTFASRAFKNQGDCVSWVATKGKNAPNG